MAFGNAGELARTILEDRPDAFLEFMARELCIPPEQIPRVRLRLEKMHASLHQTLFDRFKEILKDSQPALLALSHPDADPAQILEVKQHFLNDLLQKAPSALSPVPLTPELRAWVQRQYSEDEIVAGLQEARAQNGTELGEVIRKLEEEQRERERAHR